jgi:hypothetical protein
VSRLFPPFLDFSFFKENKKKNKRKKKRERKEISSGQGWQGTAVAEGGEEKI